MKHLDSDRNIVKRYFCCLIFWQLNAPQTWICAWRLSVRCCIMIVHTTITSTSCEESFTYVTWINYRSNIQICTRNLWVVIMVFQNQNNLHILTLYQQTWLSNKALTEIQKLKVKLQYFIEGSVVDLAHIFSSTVFTRNLCPCSAGGDWNARLVF